MSVGGEIRGVFKKRLPGPVPPNGRAFSGEPSERSERPERKRGRRVRCKPPNALNSQTGCEEREANKACRSGRLREKPVALEERHVPAMNRDEIALTGREVEYPSSVEAVI